MNANQMTEAEGIKFVKVIVPQVNINALSNKTYAILEGPSENNALQAISTSFSNNTININANPPNGTTFIGRYVPIEVTFEINFTGQSGGVGIPLLQCPGLRHSVGVPVGNGAYDAPRAYCLQNATNSLQIKLGDATISQNINQFWRNFNHYYNDNNNRFGYRSSTPSQLDPSFDYQNTFGTLQNPMLGAYDLPDGVECPRGGFVDCLVTRNDATGTPADQAQVIITVREPLLISPFLPDGNDAINAVSFMGLQTMSLIYNLGGRGSGPTAGLLGALWSHNANSPSTINGGFVNVLKAEADFIYATPDPTQLLNFAEGFSYSFHDPQLYPTTVNQIVNPGDTVTVVMNNIQLGSVPNRLYISVQEADQLFDFTKTDTFLSIEQVSISFDNRSSLLSTFTPHDLWLMSRRAGSVQSWRQFKYDQGSVICVQFGVDLALGATLTAGVIGNFSLNAKVTFTNQTNRPINAYTLNCVVVQEGVMTISSNRCYRTLGPIDRSDVIASKTGVVVPYHHPTNFYGGGFVDKLKQLFGRVAPWMRTGIDMATRALPQYAPALNVASDALRLTGNGLVGGRRRRVRAKGGEVMSREELLGMM